MDGRLSPSFRFLARRERILSGAKCTRSNFNPLHRLNCESGYDDYSFNFGINPTFHLGSNVVTFNTGIQETIRRDSLSPVQMDQNLFRQFLYMSTSSFFNMVSVSGYAIHETGPFTFSNLRLAGSQ